MAEKFANNFETTLAAAITSTSATTITVAAAAPAALQGGEFRIAIETELLLVTSGQSTTTWTVTRGVESTTAATHVTALPVTHILTSTSLGLAVSESSALTAKAAGLIDTPIKTANYSLLAGDFARFDTTTGVLVATLPTAPADNTRCGAKIVTLSGTNGVTIQTGGSDVINKPGGGTTAALSLMGHAAILQYAAFDSTWTVHSTDVPLTGLDARYATIAQGTDSRTPTAHAASHASAGSDPVTLAESQVTNLVTDLSAKAPLASPALTGNPTAPTQTQGNNSTRVASTAYVMTEVVLPHQRVVPLTDAATITPNADTTDVGYVTLGGNRTLANAAGTPIAGQQLMLRFKQDGTGTRLITWDTNYRFSTDLPSPTLSTAIGKTDYVLFQWNAVDSKWDCLAVNRGF